jgi:hypothetical protein
MPSDWQVAYTVLLVVPLLFLGGYALRVWWRQRDLVPLACLLGGAVCTVFEPIVDVLGLCWYPRHGQVRLFEAFGRPIPVGVLFGYTWAMGGMTVVFLQVLARRGVGYLWRLYPVVILITVPFELIANHTGYYVYYGHQPLRIFAYPLWWGPVNMAVPIVAAVAISWLRPYLHGVAVVVAAAIVVMADGAVNAATAWPVWTALNSAVPRGVVQVAGLATIGLAFLLVRLVTLPRVPAADVPEMGKVATL